jgi:hypothetical protein
VDHRAAAPKRTASRSSWPPPRPRAAAAADFPVARLTTELERERAFRPQAFGFELVALQFKPMGVAFEGFFQGSDDDAREPCLEAAKSGAAAGLELLRLVRRLLAHLPDLAAAREIGDTNHRIEDLKPGKRHHFAPNHARRNAFCASVSEPPALSTGTISTCGSSASTTVDVVGLPVRPVKAIDTESPGLC